MFGLRKEKGTIKINKETTLTSSELGWLLLLAELHYDSKQFQNWIAKNKLERLNETLKLLICKIHPNNFILGNSKTIWILKKKKESK